MTAGHVTNRPLHGMRDVLAVHSFLADVMAATHSARTWEVRRWEGRFWHDDPDVLAAVLAEPQPTIRIWEAGGDIVAVAHPEGTGDVHLQLAPADEGLADEMLAWAERELSRSQDGARTLTTLALDSDEERTAVLVRRGYVRNDHGEVHRRRALGGPIVTRDVPDGYVVRALEDGDVADATRLAELINTAFGHDFGPGALLNFARSPSYLADCQMVAVAPDGTHAAHAGVVVDRRNALAIVEPVCTHPDHRRLGLAAACIATALHRAGEHGATEATVSTGTENPSNALYAGLGFTDQVEVLMAWTRRWEAGDRAS